MNNPQPDTIQPLKPKELFILGLTHQGKPFRPSDWAERLCGVLSAYRPAGKRSQIHFTYSPYALPIMINDIKCVVIDERLAHIEPKALSFVQKFAQENNLQIVEACLIPENFKK